MKNFWVRAASAVVYVALFLGCIYSGQLIGNEVWGHIVFALFLLFVGCGCTFEFYRIVGKQGATPSRWIGYASMAIVAIAGFLPNGIDKVLCAFLLLSFPLAIILQLWKQSEQPFREAAYSVLPLCYISTPMLCMMMMQVANPNMLVMILVMVWLNDNGAYMGGSLVGKHKMWPRHSPGKTWEGSIIGAVCTLVAACIVGPLLVENIAWYHWLILGLISSACGLLGDLVESMLKRSVGVKDSGTIMPGHGGFLDRFDSLLIVLPPVYCFLILIGVV